MKKISDIMIFEVTMNDYLDRAIHNPSRILAIQDNSTLNEFAKQIVKSFNFDFDHCFGFYNLIHRSTYSESTEMYELFAEMSDDKKFQELLGKKNKGIRKGVYRVQTKTAFNIVGKKMLFIFDYGDNWHFIVQLKEIAKAKPNRKYPYIVKKTGRSPIQYKSYF